MDKPVNDETSVEPEPIIGPVEVQVDRVPIAQQIRCIARELAIRHQAYPRWVKSGKMKQFESDRELNAMEAVLETLKRLEPPF